MIIWLCATLLFTGVALSWTAHRRVDSKSLRHSGGVLVIAGLLILGFALPATRIGPRYGLLVSVAATEQQ